MIHTFRFSQFDLITGMAGGMALISAMVAVITCKKIEYARFCSDAGVAILDIARSGPDIRLFDDFISGILRSSESARADAE